MQTKPITSALPPCDVKCLDCFEFKTRTITKKTLPRGINRINVEDVAIDVGMPLIWTVVRSVRKWGKVEIFYCSRSLTNRDVYIQSPGSKLWKIRPKEGKCRFFTSYE